MFIEISESIDIPLSALFHIRGLSANESVKICEIIKIGLLVYTFHKIENISSYK